MWVELGLLGAAVFLTLSLGMSVCILRKRAAGGCAAQTSWSLLLTGALWAVLGVLLFPVRGAGAVPGAFVFAVYLVGGVGEVASLMVLRDGSTDSIAALGLRAGIVAIPLVLVLFAGFRL